MTESRQLTFQALPGSSRLPGGTTSERVPGDEPVAATLVLRRRNGNVAPPAAQRGQRLTRQGLAEQYGASPEDITAVRDVLTEYGIRVVSTDAGSRRMRVEGPTSAFEQVFATRLHRPQNGEHARLREGRLSVPAPIGGIVTAVLGLDDRRQAQTRHVIATPHALNTSYSPADVAEIYQMPQADGSGQTVAVIELGGGFAQGDLDTYFKGLGIPTPEVTSAGVDGATNVPGKDPQGADGEVLLDIEVIGAIAPASKVIVYFAPNTDAGFLDAVSNAAHADPTPVAISISWGQSEDQWTAQARNAMDQAFADAVALGVTVTAAAGDNGSADNDGSGVHADFPASSPNVLGCGGTTLHADGSTITSETVWGGTTGDGATGGGVSDAFPMPHWQDSAGVPDRAGTMTKGRGVPDVAGNADPATGYRVYVDGKAMVIGGTSAVAPLWAALVARVAQDSGPLGLINTTLYAGATAGTAAPGLRDITEGSNGSYRAGPGWDPCTGLGVPDAGTAGLWSQTG